MSFEDRRFTCVSTGHLRHETVKLIEDDTENRIVLAARYIEGFFVWTGDVSSGYERANHFPEELRAVLDAAAKAGFDYVQFDCDGPVMDEFPVFEW